MTNSDFTSVPHGNRALATKDMRKSQGKGLGFSVRRSLLATARVQNVKRSLLWNGSEEVNLLLESLKINA